MSEIPEKENRAHPDRLIQAFGELPCQNGSRSFPRRHWPDGVTSRVHLTGDQKTEFFLQCCPIQCMLCPFLLKFWEVSRAGRIWMMCLKLFCAIGHV